MYFQYVYNLFWLHAKKLLKENIGKMDLAQ